MFNWISFLTAHNIEFVRSGPNVARNNVAIKCPWCGDSDTSHHLGISTLGSGWGCWRNSSHRGKNPRRLVQALLRCSYEYSVSVVEGTNSVVLFDEAPFIDQINQLFGNKNLSIDNIEILNRPKEFKLIADYTGLGKLVFDYIVRRDYTEKETSELTADYKLWYTTSGPFSYRVIIPVFMEQGLVTWTARAISASPVRYKSLSPDKEKAGAQNTPVALQSIKNCLWNYKDLIDNPGEKLIICEGPFDAIRVDFFGKEIGIRATCLFSKSISPIQLTLLDELSYIFKDKILLLDNDAKFDYLFIMDEIKRMGFKSQQLPNDVKDPAELSRKQILSL